MKRALQMFRDLRFQNKLLLSYLLVVLIPLCALVFYSGQQINSTLLRQAEMTFRDVCINVSQDFASKFQRLESAFSLIVNHPTLGQIINADYSSNYQKYYDVTHTYDPIIDTTSELNPEIKRIHVYTEGSIKGSRLTFHDLSEALSEDDLALLSAAITSTWFVQDGHLYIARRVFDTADLSRSAIVAAEIDLEQIMDGEFFDGAASCQLLIHDSSGGLVYDSMATPAVQPESPAVLSDADDQLQFTNTLLPDGWTLTIRMDKEDLLVSSSMSAFQPAFLQVAIAAIFPVFIIPLLTRIIVRRIEVLNRYLRRVAKNRFREDISSDDRDEIGMIINNVGNIVRDMRALIAEVNASHLQQREAEIKALQAQINPHFLYNTLSAINWQAIRSGNEEISRIATALSTFYRSTLNQGKSITTVCQELETTRAYLDIQHMTHRGAFDIVYNVDDSLLEYNMPGMILQPLVENAIEHGISMKSDGQRGKIQISIRRDGTDILFEIYDNGPGIPPDLVQTILHDERRGYGVKNVNQRLKLFFGSDYGLSFRSGNGTWAIIRIPPYIDVESLKEMT